MHKIKIFEQTTGTVKNIYYDKIIISSNNEKITIYNHEQTSMCNFIYYDCDINILLEDKIIDSDATGNATIIIYNKSLTLIK